MPSALNSKKPRFLQVFWETKPSSLSSFGFPFIRNHCRSTKKPVQYSKHIPSLYVLFRCKVLLMFQFLPLFLLLFQGREISGSRKYQGLIHPKFGHKFCSQFSLKRQTTCDCYLNQCYMFSFIFFCQLYVFDLLAMFAKNGTLTTESILETTTTKNFKRLKCL